MEITIKTLTGKALHLKIKPTDTILHVKERIEATEGIPPDQQELLFSGQQLPDIGAVKDYNIANGCILHLSLRLPGIEITIIVITYTGKALHIEIKPTDSILHVKKRIEESDGISPDHQRLTFQGRQLRDIGTVEDYNIANGSTLRLLLRLRGCDCGLDPGHDV